MPRYILDTNLYIRAMRDEQASEELEQFVAANTPWLHLHSVVALELLAGAAHPPLRRDVQKHLIAPFERRNRLMVPGYAAWKEAAVAMAELRRRKRIGEIGRSFQGDCLLAASAREHGFVLVTANARDFELIAEVLPFRFDLPWPGAG